MVYLPKKKERKKQARRLAGARAIFVSVLRPTDSPIRATRFITFVAARVLCRIIPGRRSRNLAIFFSLAIYSFVHPKIEIDLELAVNELRKRFPQLPSTLYAYDACTLRVFRSNFHQIINKTNSSNFCQISSEQLSEDVNSAMKG